MTIVNDYIPIAAKNKTNSIAALFEARKFYEESTIPFITSSYLDFVLAPEQKIKKIPFSNLYKENAFFGIVDSESDIITPLKKVNNFASIGQKDGKEIIVQNFVADAFNAMKNFLNTQLVKNNVNKSSPFYNIKAIKGYTDIDKLYAYSFIGSSDRFKTQVLANKQLDTKIKSIDDFNNEFIKYLKTNLLYAPVTKSRTVSYFNMSSFTSGLMIQYMEEDAGDDENKYLKYMLDDGFICFSEACARFGFKFDKHLPFIIIADLKSDGMKPYYQKYGLDSAEDVFKKRYKKVFYDDLNELKNNFYNAYFTFMRDNTYFYDNCGNLTYRELISPEGFINKYPDNYWMRIYIYFKILELNLDFSQQQFENLVRSANEFISVNRLQDALKTVNLKFDELSSASYFNSLQPADSMIQSEDPPVGSKFMTNIVL